MAYGDKPKKREKDDMGNKGRRSGKGPKPMNKAGRESARQERKNLETENPVVNRSNDSGFDYTQSNKKLKSRYKKMGKGGSVSAAASIPHGTVGRFVGSTKPLGNTKAMSAMMGKTIEAGLSAQLGEKIAKVPTMRNVSASPKATIASRVDPGMLLNETATTGTTFNKPTSIKQPIEMSPMKTTGSFKPSKRDMELKEAHLGEMQTKKAGGVVKPPIVTKEGPKPQKPKSKSAKPKGRLKQKVKNALTRKKRKIKAKF